MRIKITNSIDDDKICFDVKTDYYNQRVANPRVNDYLYEVVNRYWDRDIKFSILVERHYEESDIFTCDPQQY